MIIVDYDLTAHRLETAATMTEVFYSWDDGDVHSMLKPQVRVPGLPGALAVCDNIHEYKLGEFENPDDRVRVILSRNYLAEHRHDFERIADQCRGWVLKHGEWVCDDVRCVSIQQQLFCRFGGIIESDAIANKKVLIEGAGSFGADITCGLVKSGVTDFILIDYDRLDVPNIMRHRCGLGDIGRYKTLALRQMILDKNPTANVTTFEEKVSHENIELLTDIVRAADIVVCAIDDRDGKALTNRLCVEEGKVCIFAGAFRRAYGGQILRVRPHQSLCYQCFLQHLPEQAASEEISNQRQASALSYSDRPVPVEPGLANDIAPITQMVCKLVIQELLKGKDTTLRSLDEDLVAPLYMWFNRREKGTDQEHWQPLEFDCDGMHVLRWYGVAIARHPDCPVCGDFLGGLAKRYGVDMPDKG